MAKMIRTLVFSPAKNGFKSVISIFCCSVSVGNITLHLQTLILSFNCNNPVRYLFAQGIWQQPVLHTTHRSHHHPVCALGAPVHSFSGSFAGRFLKHLGDVATVLLDVVCVSLFCFLLSLQTDWMMMRSDLAVVRLLVQTKISLDY